LFLHPFVSFSFCPSVHLPFSSIIWLFLLCNLFSVWILFLCHSVIQAPR
jgi:hypothetical protein